ncbi:Fpg/Nei family DNA glycosylase [Pilimelia columellifera]|uniref:Fpg/Nei family DNA glycosylase n=1 Tax=Pilimelia columellifera subsp. columellifera TaxID=706583 RepID=A0ABN3NB66_9ACTN
MPELPEVEALAAFLRERAVGRVIGRVDVAAFSVLKTVEPAPSDLVGATVVAAARHGKFLDLSVDTGAHLLTHLARAGWLRFRDAVGPPPKPGKGPIALRVALDDGAGFDLTEAGTQKRLAVYVVRDPSDVPGVAALGPDALAVDRQQFAGRLRARRGQVKGALTDQTVVAGIGNAYSDEILHVARLSPFALTGRMSEEQHDRLFGATQQVLAEAVTRLTGQRAATLKAEKRSGLRVHARAGLPCPVCGDLIREVSFADSSLQYCPGCQTGGRPLADRRLSKLVR